MVFTWTDDKRFSNKHYMLGHKTYYELSSNLLTLVECCNDCQKGIYIPDDKFKPPNNIDMLICKSQRDYRTECCSCSSVTECRAKHNCCCGILLDNEKEKKRLEDKKFKASQLVANDPELAEMVCETKSSLVQDVRDKGSEIVS